MAMIGGAQIGSGTYATNAAAPKEIGFLQRIEGLRSGLDELHDRLKTFSGRLTGGPDAKDAPVPQPLGLAGELTAAEHRLRECMVLVGSLNETF